MRFRLVTYNIHKGIGGVDRRYRLGRIIETLKRYDPDIVLLQEVDDGVARSLHHRQAELLGDALNMSHYAYQRNVQLKEGHYGNAILSRHALAVVGNVDLTLPLKKRRRALVVHCHLRVDGRWRSLLIANVHLGLAGMERQIQLRRLLAHRYVAQSHQRSPLLIGGDFNDVWGTLGKRVMLPAGFRSAGKKIRTFPAAMPLRPLDRIFYRGKLVATHTFAARCQSARQASDHLPLVAEFQFE